MSTDAPTSRYNLRSCAVGNHLFNLEHGFFLCRDASNEDYEYDDKFICPDHNFAFVHDNNQIVLLKLKDGKFNQND